MTEREQELPVPGMLQEIVAQLRQQGIDLENLRCGDSPGSRVKVVCVAPTMNASVEELSRATRDQVVMVRLDEEATRKLDAWVETGALRSRSQAAALFIREGLAVREAELEELKDAIRGVDEARERLRAKARQVLGTEDVGQ